MNKLLVIGLIVVVVFGMALYAFMYMSNEGTSQPEPAAIDRSSEPEPAEPVPSPSMNEPVLYKGLVVEIREGSVLTTGVEGIIGSVVVHLPEGFDMTLLPEIDDEILVEFDGAVAESYPMQIWAQKIILSEEDLIPLPDLPEEPKEIPLPPDVEPLPQEAIRFTVDNAIRSIYPGDAFEVILDVNPTTGYRTEIAYADELMLESDVLIPKGRSSNLVGAGSVRILQFTAGSTGTFAIECQVIAPSGEPMHTYTIEVEVLPER